MSNITSSAVKLEMSEAFDPGTHTFSSGPALSSGDLTPSQTRLRRRYSQSPKDSINVGIHPEDEKPKRPRASTGRGGRASVMARPHLMPGEEITYTPTTHRISKAKKGKKVHNCTFPGCPKIFTRAEHRK
ncbi:MAG: hypothetical protein OHK93_000331 [Ramalina farinacea]|uniref:Uncharacterized protein n=1 Tax=Ramalina farinacea TaxID=258253 RepID=A0AA43QJ02_9LECA|nr:hypothetical protein [Ramalina farinacea]